MKVLKALRIERCIGCHVCSMTCARLVHNILSWESAGIRIRSTGGISTGFEARYCLACEDPACARACPTEAIIVRRSGGIKIKRELCIKCTKCKEACPVEAITLSPSGDPIVCIHCGLCTRFCPHGCLEMVEVNEEAPLNDKSMEAAR